MIDKYDILPRVFLLLLLTFVIFAVGLREHKVKKIMKSKNVSQDVAVVILDGFNNATCYTNSNNKVIIYDNSEQYNNVKHRNTYIEYMDYLGFKLENIRGNELVFDKKD